MPGIDYDKLDKLFIKYLCEKKMEIKWYKDSFKLSTNFDLKSELKNEGLNIKEDTFIEEAFQIINDMRHIALNDDISYISDTKLNMINNYFLENPDVKDYLLARCMSNFNLISNIDYEILTKRDNKNIKKILAYSALLNIVYAKPLESKKTREQLAIELSKKDIQELISSLQEILENINKVGE